MATAPEFIAFIEEQIKNSGSVRSKKMFGEYIIYVNEKPLLTVCNNTVYVKMADALTEIMQSADKGSPYNGAKEHYILDVEDEALSARVLEILEKITPIPKKKK